MPMLFVQVQLNSYLLCTCSGNGCILNIVMFNEIARERQQSAVLFYENMMAELSSTYSNGKHYLKGAIGGHNGKIIRIT